MTQAVIPLAFEDHLVRSVVVDGEPWFVGKDVCAVLDITKHHQALDRLDEDERGTCNVGTPSGIQEMIIISEPGVYRLVFTSRKPLAERFKRWLAHEVLPALRRDGRYQRAEADGAPEEGEPLQMQALKLSMVREARLIFGPERAGALWTSIGLPAVPNPYPAGHEEPFRALDLLTHAMIAGTSLRSMLLSALDGGDEPALQPAGIRALPERREPAFAVWPQGALPSFVVKDTEFQGRLGRVLARLPGAEGSAVVKIAGEARRCTIIPARYLDENPVEFTPVIQ